MVGMGQLPDLAAMPAAAKRRWIGNRSMCQYNGLDAVRPLGPSQEAGEGLTYV